MWGLFCLWSLFLIAQAIVVGVSMHGRYKMVLCYLAGDMLEPAPHAPQSGSAQRSVQGIPVSPCLLLRCCFLVAVKGLRFSISLPSFLVFCLLCRSLVLFSPCCPLLFWIQAQCCSSTFCSYTSGYWFLNVCGFPQHVDLYFWRKSGRKSRSSPSLCL